MSNNLSSSRSLSSPQSLAESQAFRRSRSVTAIVEDVVNFTFGTIEVLLALRFVFILLGQDVTNSFARTIYIISEPFMLPFEAISRQAIGQGPVIEWAILFAIGVYAIAAIAVVRFFEILFPTESRNEKPNRVWTK